MGFLQTSSIQAKKPELGADGDTGSAAAAPQAEAADQVSWVAEVSGKLDGFL